MEGEEVITKEEDEGCNLQSKSEVFSGGGSLSTSTNSSSAPCSFTRAPDSVSDEEHNVRHELMIDLAHLECSPWF